MNIIHFDAQKYYLGKLCKENHEWNQTGKTLRRKSSRACIECAREELRQRRFVSKLRSQENKNCFDEEKHYLGKLCIISHNWKDTNFSLRNIKSGDCVFCARERSKKQREFNSEHCRSYQKEWRLNNADYKKEYDKRYKKFYKTTLNGSFVLADGVRRRRSKKRNVHHVSYNLEQIESLVQKFDNSCAYCSKKVKLTIDHFIPTNKGGSDCLGNIIPACSKCNSSKQDSDPKEWYTIQPFYSVKRWKKILKILGKRESTYNQIPLL